MPNIRGELPTLARREQQPPHTACTVRGKAILTKVITTEKCCPANIPPFFCSSYLVGRTLEFSPTGHTLLYTQASSAAGATPHSQEGRPLWTFPLQPALISSGCWPWCQPSRFLHTLRLSSTFHILTPCFSEVETLLKTTSKPTGHLRLPPSLPTTSVFLHAFPQHREKPGSTSANPPSSPQVPFSGPFHPYLFLLI